jgi:hypothetical protein
LCVCSFFVDYFSGFHFFFSYFFFGLIFFLRFFCFLVNSFFLFYILFEFVFFVLFVYLFGWGYSSRRGGASMYMIFYTLVVSLPLFISLVYFYLFGGCGIFKGFSVLGGV